MRDRDNRAEHAAPEVEPTEEPGAAGEIVRPARFGIGARATILLGMAMGAVFATTAALPAFSHTTVSAP